MVAKWEQRNLLEALGGKSALINAARLMIGHHHPIPEQNCTDSASPRADNASSVRDDLRGQDLNSSVLASFGLINRPPPSDRP